MHLEEGPHPAMAARFAHQLVLTVAYQSLCIQAVKPRWAVAHELKFIHTTVYFYNIMVICHMI
jgi:hypothetical protein